MEVNLLGKEVAKGEVLDFGLGLCEKGLPHHNCSISSINYTTMLLLILLVTEIILIRTVDEKY